MSDLSIACANVSSVTIAKEKGGTITVTGSYELISSKGTVLAKQGFNGYNEITVAIDPTLTHDTLTKVQKAIEKTIGIEEDLK